MCELKEKFSSIESENQSLQEQVATLASSLESSELECAGFRDQCALQQKQNAELEQQLVNIHTAHEGLESSKQELEECYEELKTSYQVSQGVFIRWGGGKHVQPPLLLWRGRLYMYLLMLVMSSLFLLM